MIGVNKTILIGTLGHDVETRHTRRDGAAVANIRVCTNTRWRDRHSGELREQTEWHSVVLFGGMANFAARFGKKGGGIYVEGHLQTRRRTMRDGTERAFTEIVARDMQLLQDRSGRMGKAEEGEANGNARKPPGDGDFEAPV